MRFLARLFLLKQIADFFRSRRGGTRARRY
jgi:hypothetical protein